MSDPEPERIGRYQLVRRIGQGGMAEVFLAKQEGPQDFSKTVVVKRMLAHLTENKKFVEMFLREARVAARLNHPNVVQIFELGQDRGTYFLAMEYIDGITLHRLAKRAWARGRALPTEVIVRAVADAAIGLHHAHTLLDESGKTSGLVHRDISPDNLMLTKDGVTKVLDFGIAKGTEKSGVTKTGELKGKIPYMSPEQIEGKPLDGRTDLFSLGVTFYWLLTGKRPFDGVTEVLTLKRVLEEEAKPPSTFNKSVPAVIDRIVMRLLEKDPSKRTSSGLSLHERLVQMLGAEAGSRKAAQELVAEMMAAPDPDDDDADATAVIRSPASMPISGSFAPTTVTRAQEPGHRRGALVGVTAAAVTGFAGAIALLLLNVPSNSDPAKLAHDAGAVAPVLAPVAPPKPVETAKPVEAKPAAVDAGVVDVVEEPRPVASPSMRTVTLKGPASVSFHVAGAPKRGGGKGSVRPGTRSVLATDARRSSTHTVPIVNDVADFDALPTGVLRVSAVPFAQVSLGAESAGQTPPPKPVTLPVGDYVVKLVWEGKTKTQKVTIEKGKTAEVRVKMNE